MFVFFEKDIGKFTVLRGKDSEMVVLSFFLTNNLVCGLWKIP